MSFYLVIAEPRLTLKDDIGNISQFGQNSIDIYKDKPITITGENLNNLIFHNLELSFKSTEGNFNKYIPLINKLLSSNKLPLLVRDNDYFKLNIDGDFQFNNEESYTLNLPLRPLVTEKFEGLLEAEYTDNSGNLKQYSQGFILIVHTDAITEILIEENSFGGGMVNLIVDGIESLALTALNN
ncbi:hypothetical protein HN415_01325 [Candidatus Woesearchaeota archaeon]|nr:hypothetical protein [Candidatus Woesearchaeota archaeon]